MKCEKCQTEWKTNKRGFSSLRICPFCGKELVDDESTSVNFDNSRDALAFIAKEHGNAAILGEKLKSFFPDYAPKVSNNIKKLVFAVYENGAAKVLQKNLQAKQADKEIAFKQAVSRLTDAFISNEAAEAIIMEFTTALGWQLNASIPSSPVPQPSRQKLTPTLAPQDKPLPSRQQPVTTNIQQKVKTQPAQTRHQSAYSSVGGVAAEILQGKTRNLAFGGYEWRLLELQREKDKSRWALLLTEDIIDKRPYNTQYTDVTWETCTLRQYLNGEFYGRFSKQEQAMISEIDNVTPDNQWYGTKGGGITTGKVFLLSIEETVMYFGDSGQLKNKNLKSECWIDDKYNDDRVAMFGNGASWWWLRSPGFLSSSAASVSYDGLVGVLGRNVDNASGGVRPALWLNL